VTCDGRLFHRRAAATGNALSPTVDRQVRRMSRVDESVKSVVTVVVVGGDAVKTSFHSSVSASARRKNSSIRHLPAIPSIHSDQYSAVVPVRITVDTG